MNLAPHSEKVPRGDLAKACSEGRLLAGPVFQELSEGVREGEIWRVVLGRMAPLEPNESWVEPYP